MSVLWSIGGFFIVLTPIVLVHELGHFLAARQSNIRVEEFGFGLPPRALKIAEKNGTIYSLNWIPLGGFVRPAGEDDPNVEGGLAGASKRARFFVLSAGAGANMIMAFVIFWIVGLTGAPAVAISDVKPDSPAQTAGLITGDVVLEVDGVKADSSRVIADPMYAKGGQPVEMLVLRDGQEIQLTVIPRESGEYDPSTEGPIGVSLALSGGGERITRNPFEAAVSAGTYIGDYVHLFLSVPGMLIRGELSPSEARPLSIVGISQIAGQSVEATASTRDLFPVLNMIAFINVALGLTNLLPIPALDGGRILFVLIEAVRGRRIEPEREGMVHVIGMLVLLGLMVLLVVQDLVNPIVPF
ncbi:MAG: site-2 protease family protein [Ardenticatenaceae bacterium]|nr:site-2 protease family protein [Ardenticatenaceae bacterium]MCB9446285.1 site-2 protease family protein [Ardenticatenaceae bacterium]